MAIEEVIAGTLSTQSYSINSTIGKVEFQPINEQLGQLIKSTPVMKASVEDDDLFGIGTSSALVVIGTTNVLVGYWESVASGTCTIKVTTNSLPLMWSIISSKKGNIYTSASEETNPNFGTIVATIGEEFSIYVKKTSGDGDFYPQYIKVGAKIYIESSYVDLILANTEYLIEIS